MSNLMKIDSLILFHLKFKENLLVVLVGITNLLKNHVLKTYMPGIVLCMVAMTIRHKELK